MRIAYVVKMFPRLSETFITNEISELMRRGLDVRTISLMRPAGGRHSEEALRIAGSTFYVPDLKSPEGRRAALDAHAELLRRLPVRYLRTASHVVRRLSPTATKRFLEAGPVALYCLDNHVTHMHAGFAHAPASVSRWASRLTGIKYSFAAHAKDLYLSDPRSLRHKMDAARFVWTCTESNVRHLRSFGSDTPVHAGYHGSDLDLLRSERITASGEIPVVLGVGRLVAKKGFDDLIRASALLAERGLPVETVLAGDGPMRASLEALAGSLGCDRVRFLGSVEHERIREEYTCASVVVLPSVILKNGDRDGVPNVLVEAMASGVPVVSTRVSAIPELIRHGETGLLVEPRDFRGLADAIEETIGDPAAARARAERARRDIEARFDLHRNSAAIAELLGLHARPTRGIYVTTDFGVPVRGHKGASAHVCQVAAGMRARGIDLRILTPDPGPEPSDGGNPVDVAIEKIAPPGWIARIAERCNGRATKQVAREILRLAYNVPVWLRVGRRIGEIHPDFVYERYALCAFGTGLACRTRGVPWILEVNAPLADEETTHRALRLSRLTRWLERRILTNADRVMVVSHALRKWAIELGVQPDRVRVVPNGVDRSRFRPGLDAAQSRVEMGWQDDDVVVAFAGSLKPWHGGMLLLDAVERARGRCPRLRLVYIGDGPERAAIEKQVRKRGLSAHVHFTGAVAQDRVPGFLRAADILVAPYLAQERFYFSPLKVLEYLAVGRPVIATRQGALLDLVPPSCGRLVEPGHRGELAEALVDLGSDPDLRRRMGLAAEASVEGCDWSDRVETILAELPWIRARRAPWQPRVAYVLKMFPRFSETFIVNEIRELERQGIDVRIFSIKRPSGARQAEAGTVRAAVTVLEKRAGALAPSTVAPHIRCLARRPRAYLRTLGFVLTRWDHEAIRKFAFAGIIADAMAREGIGHVHAHFASTPARVAKFAAMLSGKPFSFTVHAKDLYWDGHEHARNHKLKRRVRMARFVVAVSRANQRFIEGLRFHVRRGRIRSLYIGLDLDEFPFVPPSARRTGPRPLILSVGRLIEKKGFHILIESLAILRSRGFSFRCLIAGEGPNEDALRAQIEANGLAGHVRLLGAVPLSRLRKRYYSRARILALPCVIAADGDRDGIPTVLLEAMASGVPVVSTNVSGIPEAIEDGVSGFLMEPGDPATLAERIATLMGDTRLADRLSRAARERVERQFDLRKNASELGRLFVCSMKEEDPDGERRVVTAELLPPIEAQAGSRTKPEIEPDSGPGEMRPEIELEIASRIESPVESAVARVRGGVGR